MPALKRVQARMTGFLLESRPHLTLARGDLNEKVWGIGTRRAEERSGGGGGAKDGGITGTLAKRRFL